MHPSLAHRVSASWLAVLGLLTILSVPAFSQSTGGRILGRVADPTGAVLASVKVIADERGYWRHSRHADQCQRRLHIRGSGAGYLSSRI